VPTPRPINLAGLDDTGGFGEFGAGSLKLFLLGARAAKVAADDARLPADELAVAGQRFNDAGADLVSRPKS
jgi:hypothetical protein